MEEWAKRAKDDKEIRDGLWEFLKGTELTIRDAMKEMTAVSMMLEKQMSTGAKETVERLKREGHRELDIAQVADRLAEKEIVHACMNYLAGNGVKVKELASYRNL